MPPKRAGKRARANSLADNPVENEHSDENSAPNGYAYRPEWRQYYPQYPPPGFQAGPPPPYGPMYEHHGWVPNSIAYPPSYEELPPNMRPPPSSQPPRSFIVHRSPSPTQGRKRALSDAASASSENPPKRSRPSRRSAAGPPKSKAQQKSRMPNTKASPAGADTGTARGGNRTYDEAQRSFLIKQVSLTVPICLDQWKAITKTYNEHARKQGWPERSYSSLRDQFHTIVRSPKPTGDREIPEYITQALDVFARIEGKGGTGFVGNSPEPAGGAHAPLIRWLGKAPGGIKAEMAAVLPAIDDDDDCIVIDSSSDEREADVKPDIKPVPKAKPAPSWSSALVTTRSTVRPNAIPRCPAPAAPTTPAATLTAVRSRAAPAPASLSHTTAMVQQLTAALGPEAQVLRSYIASLQGIQHDHRVETQAKDARIIELMDRVHQETRRADRAETQLSWDHLLASSRSRHSLSGAAPPDHALPLPPVLDNTAEVSTAASHRHSPSPSAEAGPGPSTLENWQRQRMRAAVQEVRDIEAGLYSPDWSSIHNSPTPEFRSK